MWSSLDLNLCLTNDHGDLLGLKGYVSVSHLFTLSDRVSEANCTHTSGEKEYGLIPHWCDFCDQGQGIIPKTRPPTSYLECVCQKPPMDGTTWDWTRIDLSM